MLPAPFLSQMQQLLGSEAFENFLLALKEPAPVSIRLNPEKQGAEALDTQPSGLAVPWHPQGRYLSKRPVFTLDPSFHAGAYYVQEASSMFLYQALQQCVDFGQPLKILDLCASPGGKSTLIASLLQGKGLLVANETIRQRINALRENLEKWGYSNVAVTSAEAEDFAALSGWFDVVVVDAPCSGEGMFRKDPDAIQEWSPAHVGFCSGRQKRILAAAVECLAPGGTLIYSTCTYNTQENVENVAWLRKEFNLETSPIKLDSDWGVSESENGYQFFPHRIKGEGFFLAVLKKVEEQPAKHGSPDKFKSLSSLSKSDALLLDKWVANASEFHFFQSPTEKVVALPSTLLNHYLTLDKHLKIKWFGTEVGVFKGKDFVPDHGLALGLLIQPELPAVDLELELALRYLKKETFDLPANTGTGWVIARFRGLNLGWLKALPNRMNNYLPQERRIRMELQ